VTRRWSTGCWSCDWREWMQSVHHQDSHVCGVSSYSGADEMLGRELAYVSWLTAAVQGPVAIGLAGWGVSGEFPLLREGCHRSVSG
jgi:hypothetical protein